MKVDQTASKSLDVRVESGRTNVGAEKETLRETEDAFNPEGLLAWE